VQEVYSLFPHVEARRDQARNSGGDNEFRAKTWSYCIGHWWLNRDRTAPAARNPEQANAPSSLRRLPRRHPAFIVHCYSAQQAARLVAARLADTTGVLIVAQRKGSPR
jgi:hypothetical protein